MTGVQLGLATLTSCCHAMAVALLVQAQATMALLLLRLVTSCGCVCVTSLSRAAHLNSCMTRVRRGKMGPLARAPRCETQLQAHCPGLAPTEGPSDDRMFDTESPADLSQQHSGVK